MVFFKKTFANIRNDKLSCFKDYAIKNLMKTKNKSSLYSFSFNRQPRLPN